MKQSLRESRNFNGSVTQPSRLDIQEAKERMRNRLNQSVNVSTVAGLRDHIMSMRVPAKVGKHRYQAEPSHSLQTLGHDDSKPKFSHS